LDIIYIMRNIAVGDARDTYSRSTPLEIAASGLRPKPLGEAFGHAATLLRQAGHTNIKVRPYEHEAALFTDGVAFPG
jgi:hypothetical protein